MRRPPAWPLLRGGTCSGGVQPRPAGTGASRGYGAHRPGHHARRGRRGPLFGERDPERPGRRRVQGERLRRRRSARCAAPMAACATCSRATWSRGARCSPRCADAEYVDKVTTATANLDKANASLEKATADFQRATNLMATQEHHPARLRLGEAGVRDLEGRRAGRKGPARRGPHQPRLHRSHRADGRLVLQPEDRGRRPGRSRHRRVRDRRLELRESACSAWRT